MSCYLLSFFSATQLAVMGSAASLWLETNAANSGFKYFSDSGVQLASGLQWFLLELKMNLLAQLQYFIAVLYRSTLSQYFVSATAAVQSNVLLSRKRNRTKPSWSFRLGSIYTELHSVLKCEGELDVITPHHRDHNHPSDIHRQPDKTATAPGNRRQVPQSSPDKTDEETLSLQRPGRQSCSFIPQE